MFRKMYSVAVVLVLLAGLTASAARARSLTPAPVTSGFAVELWEWTLSSLGSAWLKAGGDMDPNGYKHPGMPRPVPHPRPSPGSREVPVKAAIR
jgi:hypothetical protein